MLTGLMCSQSAIIGVYVIIFGLGKSHGLFCGVIVGIDVLTNGIL
jgi:hypothetical protein